MKSKVLLIEDGVTIHRVIDLYIDFDKFDLVKVFTREDADIKLKSDKFDYILLDHKLENIILNSYVQELKKLQPNASVILLVGAFDRFNADTLAASGADDYITKPFDAQSLNSKLASDEGVMKASLVEEIAVKDQLRDSNEPIATPTSPQNISQNNIMPDSASQAASLASSVPSANDKAAYLSSLEDSVVDDPTEDGYVDEPVEDNSQIAATINLNELSEPPTIEASPTKSNADTPEKLDPALLSSPLNLLMHDSFEEPDPAIDDPIISEENIGKETELFLDQSIESAKEVISEVAPVVREADYIEEPTLSNIEEEVVHSTEVDLSVPQVEAPSIEEAQEVAPEVDLLSANEAAPSIEEATATINLEEASPEGAEAPASKEVLMHADELPELDMSSLVDTSSKDDEEFTLTITSHADESTATDNPLQIEASEAELPEIDPSLELTLQEEINIDNTLHETESSLDKDAISIEPNMASPILEPADIELSLDEPATVNLEESLPGVEAPVAASGEVLMHADELPPLDMSSLVDPSAKDDEEFTLTITSHADESANEPLVELEPEAPIEEESLNEPISEDLTQTLNSNVEELPIIDEAAPLVEEEPVEVAPVSILGSKEPTIDMLNASLGLNQPEEKVELIEDASLKEEESIIVASNKDADETPNVAETIMPEESTAESNTEELTSETINEAPTALETETQNKPLVDDDDWLSDAPGANDVVDILGTLPDKTDAIESELEHAVPTLDEAFNEEEETAATPILEEPAPIVAEDTAPEEVPATPTLEEPAPIIAEDTAPEEVPATPILEEPAPIVAEDTAPAETLEVANTLELAEDEEIVEEIIEEEVEEIDETEELAEDEEIVEEIVEEEVEEEVVDELEEEIKDEFAHDNVFQTDLMMDDADPLSHIADTPMDDYSDELEEAEEQIQHDTEERQHIVPVPPMPPQNNLMPPINTQFNGGGITISISREEILSMLGSAIDKQLLENAIKEVVAKNMQEIVRNVVPTVAEQYIKEEIERLKNDGK